MRQRKGKSKKRNQKEKPGQNSSPDEVALDPKRKTISNKCIMISLGVSLTLIFLLNVILRKSVMRNYGYFIEECIGTCEINKTLSRSDGPFDTPKLIYLRVPKTGSTSLIELFHSALKQKAVQKFSFPEWTDVVPKINTEELFLINKKEIESSDSFIEKNLFQFASFFKPLTDNIPSFDNNQNSGYSKEQNEGYNMQKRFNFYKSIARKVLFPTSANFFDRHFFNGHIFHLNWLQANDIFPKVNSADLEKIEEMTFLRHPVYRLHSQYNYDRQKARNSDWRRRFVKVNGNESFVDCVLDQDCSEKNELQRWCNLQTEMFCGLNLEVCIRPVNEKSLETAKENLKKMLFVGIVDEIDKEQVLLKKSLDKLKSFLPVYFGNMKIGELGTEKKGKSRLDLNELDENVKTKLSEICKFDLELFEYAKMLL
eukprot:snap_masked-scaffold_30-processed-gene-0.33-mRNA-1 protein AED:1.00 eAED:1.00 QI:0/-1/0/0/-1/1/1/0/425